MVTARSAPASSIRHEPTSFMSHLAYFLVDVMIVTNRMLLAVPKLIAPWNPNSLHKWCNNYPSMDGQQTLASLEVRRLDRLRGLERLWRRSRSLVYPGGLPKGSTCP